jgi:hypothetical protein
MHISIYTNGSDSRFFCHSVLAIAALSGTDFPWVGMPLLYALIMTGFPPIALMHPGAGDEPHPPASSGWLEAMTCHAS